MDLEDALHAFLEEKILLVSGQVYSEIAPEQIKNNYLIHQKISGNNGYAHDGPTGLLTSNYQFDSYAYKKSDAKAIIKQLKGEIDGYNGFMNGIRVQGVFLLDEDSDYEKDTKLHRLTAEYRFQHYE